MAAGLSIEIVMTKKTQTTAPEYWEQAIAELIKRDRILRKIIQPAQNNSYPVSQGKPFMTLARAIVGQQVSVQSSEAIWKRFTQLCKNITPAAVLRLSPQQMQGVGLSKRKVEYIQDLAQHFKDGHVHSTNWPDMGDQEIIDELIQIRGIGRWTAEMFLIFHLCRPNVLPLDDLGLLKSISLNYFSGESVSRHDVREMANNWQPWCTVATWYLWRSLDPIPVEY